MSPKRAWVFSCLGMLLVLAAGAWTLTLPGVQTAIVRRKLASLAPAGTSIERARMVPGSVILYGLDLPASGSVVRVPKAECRIDLWAAATGKGLRIEKLTARDFSVKAASGVRPVGTAAAGSEGLARVIGGLLAVFNVPAELSLAEVDLSGNVDLSDERGDPVGKAAVSVAGGGLEAGKAGHFDCSVSASVDRADAPVSEAIIRANVIAELDSLERLTRLGVRMTAKARGREFPEGISLEGSASASRGSDGITCSVTLARGGDMLAAIEARNPAGSSRLDGVWRLDLRDSDLEPFMLGRHLPVFYAVGTGRYDTDASSGSVHVDGALHVVAERLDAVMPSLGAMGNVVVEAGFDFAKRGSLLKVDSLQLSLSGAEPVAMVRALQPFEFDVDTAELKVGHPSGDLVGVDLQGVPLSWLQGALPAVAFSPTAATGSFVIRAEDGRLALRTKAPLSTRAPLSISIKDRSVARDLDISTFVLADYAPQGWQLQVSPLSVRSAGQRILSLEARFGRLSGSDTAIKAAGSWSAQLPGILSQPLAAGSPELSSGNASGSFEASLSSNSEVSVKAVVQDLAAGPSFAATLPSYVSADLRADFGSDGMTRFNLPLRLDYGSRSAEMLLSGSVLGTAGGRTLDASLSGSGLTQADLAALAAVATGRVADRPTGPSGTGPAEAGPAFLGGRLALKLRDLSLRGLELRDVSGRLRLEGSTLGIEEGKAQTLEGNEVRVTGSVGLPRGSGEPYVLNADLEVTNLDAGGLFASLEPGAPPAVEGKFDLAAKISSRGADTQDLTRHVQGEARLASHDGKVRFLKADVADALKQNTGRLAEAVDSVTSFFGRKNDNLSKALTEAATAASEVQYDQLTVKLVRDSDMNLRMVSLALLSPEMRIGGSGLLHYVAGLPLREQPLDADLDIAVRGRLQKGFELIGLLKDESDELGYRPVYQSVHFSGTLRAIDSSQWKDLLVQAPLRKGSGFIDKILRR